jgi:two-component sensor histidine kinase
VQDLLETILSAFSQYTVKIKNRVAPVKLPVKMTSAIGLIINELATNAMKHGFRRDEENQLTVSLKEKGEKAVLQIESSGEPLPEDFSFAAGEGFGLALVTELVRQIDGNLEVKGKPSPEFTITFPWPEYGFGGLKT